MRKIFTIVGALLATTCLSTAMDQKEEVNETSSTQKLSEKFLTLKVFSLKNTDHLQQHSKDLEEDVLNLKEKIFHLEDRSEKASCASKTMATAGAQLQILNSVATGLENVLQLLQTCKDDFANEKTETGPLSKKVMNIYSQIKTKKAGDLLLFGGEQNNKPFAVLQVGQNSFIPGAKTSTQNVTFSIERETDDKGTDWSLHNGQSGRLGVNYVAEKSNSESYHFVTWNDQSTLIFAKATKEDKDPKFININQNGKEVGSVNLKGNTNIKIASVFGDTMQKRFESSINANSAAIVWTVGQLLPNVKTATELAPLWDLAISQVEMAIVDLDTTHTQINEMLSSTVSSISTDKEVK